MPRMIRQGRHGLLLNAGIEQGLSRGGVRRPDLARLRLAWIAAGVAGLARLWRIHLSPPAR